MKTRARFCNVLCAAATFVVALNLFAVGAAAPYLEITGEFEIKDWHLNYLRNENTNHATVVPRERLFSPMGPFRCVVGQNRWMIEFDSINGIETYWFTGRELISNGESRGQPVTRLTVANETTDGNPGRPGGVSDLMFGTAGKIPWLVYCSGSVLKSGSSRIYPPGEFWKESAVYRGDWVENAVPFPDELGLPINVNLHLTNSQPLFRYQVHSTTNMLGWTIPTEFSAVQYWLNGRNSELYLTIKGRLTSIRETSEPVVPPEILKRARNPQ